MSMKQCGKCTKIVYPTEELKCLDKTWHKACFRCEACGMMLNMKNYKGYDKKPYCNAHYPTTKHTQVADTPESRRIAENTKLQSNIQYHATFEKEKGRYTTVTDDPELMRLKQNQDKISNIGYHNEFQKGLGKYTVVADDPETKRLLDNTQKFSMVKYHEDFEKNLKGSKIQVADDPETARVMKVSQQTSQVAYQSHAPGRRPSDVSLSIPMSHHPPSTHEQKDFNSPYSGKTHGSVIYNSTGQGRVDPAPPRNVGSITDYDPMNEQFGSLTTGYRPASTSTGRQEWEEAYPEPKQPEPEPDNDVFTSQPIEKAPAASYPPSGPPAPVAPEPTPPPPQPASMASVPYLPVNQTVSLQVSQERQQQPHYPAPSHAQPAPASYSQPPPPMQAQPPVQAPIAPAPAMQAPVVQPPVAPVVQAPVATPAPASAKPQGQYQAMYDYTADDQDEVSFLEGDMFTECEVIDEGWMVGINTRSGERGMLPANYVEAV